MSNTFVGMPAFPEAAKVALVDTQLRRNLAHATGVIRAKRDGVVAELDDWEELRRSGAAIKDRVLRHLDAYLEQFEAAATASTARSTSRIPTPVRTATSTACWMTGPSIPGSL